MPYYIWDQYVYTSKLGVPCVKIFSTVPKIWRAMPIFLARVNGVSINSKWLIDDECGSAQIGLWTSVDSDVGLYMSQSKCNDA